eukprot:GHVQ01015095.1.p1 GENE.GHVQ01015095.1~~GHVQ01015095.1.p1  ORF type:complete len:527 (+),score=64.08 GHVQ01015095.1:198-1778(+)
MTASLSARRRKGSINNQCLLTWQQSLGSVGIRFIVICLALCLVFLPTVSGTLRPDVWAAKKQPGVEGEEFSRSKVGVDGMYFARAANQFRKKISYVVRLSKGHTDELPYDSDLVEVPLSDEQSQDLIQFTKEYIMRSSAKFIQIQAAAVDVPWSLGNVTGMMLDGLPDPVYVDMLKDFGALLNATKDDAFRNDFQAFYPQVETIFNHANSTIYVLPSNIDFDGDNMVVDYSISERSRHFCSMLQEIRKLLNDDRFLEEVKSSQDALENRIKSMNSPDLRTSQSRLELHNHVKAAMDLWHGEYNIGTGGTAPYKVVERLLSKWDELESQYDYLATFIDKHSCNDCSEEEHSRAGDFMVLVSAAFLKDRYNFFQHHTAELTELKFNDRATAAYLYLSTYVDSVFSLGRTKEQSSKEFKGAVIGGASRNRVISILFWAAYMGTASWSDLLWLNCDGSLPFELDKLTSLKSPEVLAGYFEAAAFQQLFLEGEDIGWNKYALLDPTRMEGSGLRYRTVNSVWPILPNVQVS